MLSAKLNDHHLTLVIARQPVIEHVIQIGEGLALGMQLETDVDTGKHIIFDVEPELAAGRAGVGDGDELIGLNNENVLGWEHERLVKLIHSAIKNTTKLHIKVKPSDGQSSARALGEVNLAFDAADL